MPMPKLTLKQDQIAADRAVERINLGYEIQEKLEDYIHIRHGLTLDADALGDERDLRNFIKYSCRDIADKILLVKSRKEKLAETQL